MAPRPFWKGFLKLSLVTCPIAMTPATTEAEKIRFHTVNRKTGNRVESRYVDAETGKPVDASDEARGYERSSGDYVLLEEDELDAVALESTRTIDVTTFVPRDSIRWVYLDRAHYLTPDDPVGEEAFAVIREAMAATNMVGISRVVLYRRERAVMLEPRGKGIIAWTLRYGDEVRDEAAYFSEIDQEKPGTKLLQLAETLIKERSKPWSPDLVKDPVQDQLKRLIASKNKMSRAKAGKAGKSQRTGNVVNLFEALKKSLSTEKAAKPERRPSK
jgi:DNA end-binding protein Ku